MLEFSVLLFGTPKIRCGNEEVRIQRRKDLALLIYLFVNPEAHSRDTLAGMLWPEMNQTKARASLRKSLSRLKKELGEESLLITQQQAGLHPGLSLELDTAQFERHVRQFRLHSHSLNDQAPHLCAECQQTLEAAAQLYTHDFLEGFNIPDSTVFEEWQFFQSESLRKSLAEVLEQLTQQYLLLEKYPEAIEYGRRWLSLDRLQEGAHRQLILLYELSGQHAAAVRQFEECERFLKEELDIPPEPETLELYEAIKRKQVQRPGKHPKAPSPAGSASAGPTRLASPLPTQPTPFLGRKRELEEIARLMGDPACRVLTLLGPGGNGKTRLAIQFADGMDQAGMFRDGVVFVSLARLSDQQSILGAITDRLRICDFATDEEARRKLLGHLQGRQLLLILDNFEHLLEAGNIRLVLDMMKAAPKSKVLVTSRERLNIQGETIFRLEGLDVPVEDATFSTPAGTIPLNSFSALELFEQSARRVEPSFRITYENYKVISDICRDVQGMPLAIELAASWLEVLSPQEIRAEISHSLDFLQSDQHDLPDRQRSVRAVFDSSWKLLDRQIRPVIKALSVFRASFSREAAQAVSGASLKTLLDLTNKSWLQRLSNGRYQIHELLRQFAYENLVRDRATFKQVKKQFGDYYAGYTHTLWMLMKGPGQSRSFTEVATEFDNIQTAWTWLVEGNKLDSAIQNILPMLFHSCERGEKVAQLREMLGTGLASLQSQKESPDRHRMEIILRTVQGAFHYDGYPLRNSSYDGIFPIDLETSRHAWSLSRRVTYTELGFWGILLAFVYGRLFHLERGVDQLRQLLPYFQEENRLWELANTSLHLAKLMNFGRERYLEQQQEIANRISQALDIFTSLGDYMHIGLTQSQWGQLKFNKNDLPGAIQQWTVAYSSLLAVGEWSTTTDVLWQLANAHLQMGSFQESIDCLHQMEQIYLEHGLKELAVTVLSKESFEKVRYGDLSEARSLRLKCIDIIHETGPEYQYAWNYWEMGEVCRVAGQLEEADGWFERSMPIFEKYHDQVGKAFYYRGKGDIALSRQEDEAARAAYSLSAGLARASRHTWTLIYALTGLATSELRLSHFDTARRYLTEAAGLVYHLNKDKGIALIVLRALAELHACEEDRARAVELAALVEGHVSCWKETREQASLLLKMLKKSMPMRVFKQAQEKGRALDLLETIKSLSVL